MAKKLQAPAVTRIIEGRLPSTGRMHRITLYENGAIRIERDNMPVLNEDQWASHKWLINLLEPKASRDERF